MHAQKLICMRFAFGSQVIESAMRPAIFLFLPINIGCLVDEFGWRIGGRLVGGGIDREFQQVR